MTLNRIQCYVVIDSQNHIPKAVLINRDMAESMANQNTLIKPHKVEPCFLIIEEGEH